MLPKELQELISTLPQETQVLFKAVVTFYENHYEGKIAKLEARIKELEDQKAKDSSNSSKPPSTDFPKKKPKILRGKTNRKPRGQEAMDDIGILLDFQGIAVHDFWRSYYVYCCEHALCNAHILRDLIFIKERFEQLWAKDLIRLLLKMKAAKEKAIEQDKTSFSRPTLQKYQEQYQRMIQSEVISIK